MSGKTGLFLLELIISILFFIIAAAVCIQLFVKAHLLDRRTEEKSGAVKLCTNYAERITAGVPEEKNIYYDKELRECQVQNAVYVLCVDKEPGARTPQGWMDKYEVYVKMVQGEEKIYSLELSLYRQEAGE